MDFKSYIWDCWQELWNPDNRTWQYIDRILFLLLPFISLFLRFMPKAWEDIMTHLAWVVPLSIWGLFLLLVVPYRLASKYKKQGKETEKRLTNEIQLINQRLQTLEDERIPHINVSTRGGHRSDNWEHEHFMWAELDIVNTSPSLTLNDVEVRIVNLLDLLEKQDEPGKYILFSLHKWNPIQVYWSERNAPASQLKRDIPPNSTRVALIAYSDNSNGPPAHINTPTSAKPLLFSCGHKIDIEVSSPNSAIWKGEFYIECHPRYVTKELPYYTEATFEFDVWEEWLKEKGITSWSILDKEDSQSG